MIRVVRMEGEAVTTGGRELLDQPSTGEGALWIDIEGAAAEHLDFLADVGLDSLVIEDIATLKHQPKLEYLDSELFLIVRGVDFNRTDDRLETLKLAAVLGDKRLVTFHRLPLRSVNRVYERIAEGKGVHPGTAAHMLYQLCDALMALYFPVLERIEEAVNALEDAVFDEPTEEHLGKILDQRRRLAELRRVMVPHRQVFLQLAESEVAQLPDEERKFFRELFDDAFRLAESIDQARDHLASVRDAHFALLGQRTNDIMKTLTILSAVMLPLSFLAGLYGMNFTNMPELDTRWGYPIVLGVMVTLAIGMISWFKHKKWI